MDFGHNLYTNYGRDNLDTHRRYILENNPCPSLDITHLAYSKDQKHSKDRASLMKSTIVYTGFSATTGPIHFIFFLPGILKHL